ncbi:MAG: superoxide dismutase family protein [Burkholderiales bacterium]|nr:superoxide dismutase family protein [Burkholderiales bacterium]
MKNLIAIAAGSVLISACAGIAGTTEKSAVAFLQPTQGNQANGAVTFSQSGNTVFAEAKVAGLTPGSHGFHIHEKGDCSAPDATSAGGHFNPDGAPHGAPQSAKRHAGDLGNLTADKSGEATLKIRVPGVTLADGPNSIKGKGVIVHAMPDDLTSQPAGNAGPRIACGVISLR